MTLTDRIKKIIKSWGEEYNNALYISEDNVPCLVDEISQTIAKNYGKNITKVFKWMQEDCEDCGGNGIDFKFYRKYLLSAFEFGEIINVKSKGKK